MALDRAIFERKGIAVRREQERRAAALEKQKKEVRVAAMRNLQQLHQQSAARNAPMPLAEFRLPAPPQRQRPAASTASAHSASCSPPPTRRHLQRPANQLQHASVTTVSASVVIQSVPSTPTMQTSHPAVLQSPRGSPPTTTQGPPGAGAVVSRGSVRVGALAAAAPLQKVVGAASGSGPLGDCGSLPRPNAAATDRCCGPEPLSSAPPNAPIAPLQESPTEGSPIDLSLSGSDITPSGFLTGASRGLPVDGGSDGASAPSDADKVNGTAALQNPLPVSPVQLNVTAPQFQPGPPMASSVSSHAASQWPPPVMACNTWPCARSEEHNV